MDRKSLRKSPEMPHDVSRRAMDCRTTIDLECLDVEYHLGRYYIMRCEMFR